MIRGAWSERAGLVALVLANLFVALQALRHEWGFYEVMLVYSRRC